MAIIKHVFRNGKKLSDAAVDEWDSSDESESFGDEMIGQDVTGVEGKNAETSSTSELMEVGELKNPGTSYDREHSPADGFTGSHPSVKSSKNSRRTLRVDAIEDQHANKSTEKTRQLDSQSKRSVVLSPDTPSAPAEPQKDDDEEELGFEIEVFIPAEPAREVLRRSSSRERGRQTRSSSREAMRQVRERSRQRRSERGTNNNLDSTHSSGERTDSGKGGHSQNGDGMKSPMNSATNPDDSFVNTNGQASIKTSEKKSRSPRPGTRSRSSERPLGSKRGAVTSGREVPTDAEKSTDMSRHQASDQGKSNTSSMNRPRGSSREGRRPRREKESTEGVAMNSNEKDSITARAGLSADAGVDESLRSENIGNIVWKGRESAKVAKGNSSQYQKRSPHLSSSRDVTRSKRSDSKERTRSSHADSKERPHGQRSSSRDRRGHGRSRGGEGLSSSVSNGKAEKEEENTGRVQRSGKSEDISAYKDDKSPLRSERHESSNSTCVPRRSSREESVQMKAHDATTEGTPLKSENHESSNSIRVPRRSSREGIVQLKPHDAAADGTALKAQNHGSSNSLRVPRRNSREGIFQEKSHETKIEDNQTKIRTPRGNSREDALRLQTSENIERKHGSSLQAETHDDRDEILSHQQSNPTSDSVASKHESTRQMVRGNSHEDIPGTASQIVADEMPRTGGSPSRVVRQRSRERRTRRPRVQRSDDRAEIVPNSETSQQKDDTFLSKEVDEERFPQEMKKSVDMMLPRALPDVIIHDEVEKQALEAKKGVGRIERCTKVSPAMTLLNHLGSGDNVVPANDLPVEQLLTFTQDDLDAQPVDVADDSEPEVADLPEEGNKTMNDPASQQNEKTLPADETNDESKIDSVRVQRESNAPNINVEIAIQQNVENGTKTTEFEAVGHNEPMNVSKAERNSRRETAKIKRKKSTGVHGGQSKDSNPADDLLGFLGSNYDDLFAKNEESFTPNASDPFFLSGDQAGSSVDFFKSINSLGFEQQSGEDDFDRIERLVSSLDNDTYKGEAKPLPPPSVAPVDESAKQKARLARRIARQKKAVVDKDDEEPPSALDPPSLTGDMPKLMQKRSDRTPKKEASAPSTRGVARSHSEDGSAMKTMLKAQERPSTKSTSGNRPKIRRAKSGEDLHLGDTMCEQSLAPPSLAPPSLAPVRRMPPKTPEKEEDMPRKVTRWEARKATKFASLDEDNDEEDSVGIIAPTTSPADLPMKKRGMLFKAQSAVNILEKTTRRVVKKAASTKNIFTVN